MNQLRLWIALVLSLAVAWPAIAVGPCPHCGCEQPCRYVTRVIPDVQRITTYEYFCQREPFCVPGPTLHAKHKCQHDPKLPCTAQCHEVSRPTSGPVFIRNQLYKRPVVVEKPVFRCVILEICCGCNQATLAPKAMQDFALAPPPPRGAPAQPSSGPAPTANGLPPTAIAPSAAMLPPVAPGIPQQQPPPASAWLPQPPAR